MNVCAASYPGHEINEDLVVYGDNYVLLLDGATSLAKKAFSEYDSNAKWYVEKISEYIKTHINNKISVRDLLDGAIDHMNKQFEMLHLEDTSNLKPSASSILIRQLDDMVEMTLIGDCSIVVCYKNGTNELIHDDKLSKLDSQVIQKMIRIAEENNISVAKARNEVVDDLVINRKKMNASDGYQALGFSKIDFNEVISLVVDTDKIDTIYAFSDGIAQYYDTLKIVDSVDEFVEVLKKYTFDEIVTQIKNVQQGDENFNQYPRFKLSDDATIAKINFK